MRSFQKKYSMGFKMDIHFVSICWHWLNFLYVLKYWGLPSTSFSQYSILLEFLLIPPDRTAVIIQVCGTSCSEHAFSVQSTNFVWESSHDFVIATPVCSNFGSTWWIIVLLEDPVPTDFNFVADLLKCCLKVIYFWKCTNPFSIKEAPCHDATIPMLHSLNSVLFLFFLLKALLFFLFTQCWILWSNINFCFIWPDNTPPANFSLGFF